MISVEISGMVDVARALSEMSRQAKNRAGRKALITALTPIVEDARRRAPKYTGNLAASIGFRYRKFRTGNQTAVIGPRKGFRDPATKRLAHKYAHLVEFGHVIASKKSARGRKGTAGGFVPAKPFIRPAFEAGRDRAVRDIARVLGSEIELTARRTARRRAKQVSV